jgi:hypothetical protein
MTRFVVGLIIGAVLVMGIASGQGGGAAGDPTSTPPPEPIWADTPMKAASGTHLAHHGFCRRGFEVRQVDGWQSRRYRCVATKGG